MPSNLTLVLLGHVGRDAELRFTSGGTPVINFSVAASWGGRDGETQWFRVSYFGKRAEEIKDSVKKGVLVQVVGWKLVASTYTGRDGQERTTLDVTASNVAVLAPRVEKSKRKQESKQVDYPF